MSRLRGCYPGLLLRDTSLRSWPLLWKTRGCGSRAQREADRGPKHGRTGVAWLSDFIRLEAGFLLEVTSSH